MVYETTCYKCSKMTYISLTLLDFVIGAVIAFVGLWLFLDWELKIYVWLPFVIVGGLLILAAVLGSACTIICPTCRIPYGIPSTLSLPGRRPAQIRWALKDFFCLLVVSSSRRLAVCGVAVQIVRSVRESVLQLLRLHVGTDHRADLSVRGGLGDAPLFHKVVSAFSPRARRFW